MDMSSTLNGDSSPTEAGKEKRPDSQNAGCTRVNSF